MTGMTTSGSAAVTLLAEDHPHHAEFDAPEHLVDEAFTTPSW